MGVQSWRFGFKDPLKRPEKEKDKEKDKKINRNGSIESPFSVCFHPV